jgi:hypothetical protein
MLYLLKKIKITQIFPLIYYFYKKKLFSLWTINANKENTKKCYFHTTIDYSSGYYLPYYKTVFTLYVINHIGLDMGLATTIAHLFSVLILKGFIVHLLYIYYYKAFLTWFIDMTFTNYLLIDIVQISQNNITSC